MAIDPVEKIAAQLFIEDPVKKIVKIEAEALLSIIDTNEFLLLYYHEIMNLVEDMADIGDMSILEYVMAYFPERKVTEDNLEDLLVEIYIMLSAETGVPILELRM